MCAKMVLCQLVNHFHYRTVKFSSVYSIPGGTGETPMPYGLLLVAGLVACVLSISALNDDANDEPLVGDVQVNVPAGR